MRIINPRTGDDELAWDPDKPEEVEKAKRTFTEKLKEGFKAFKMVKETVSRKGEEIKEFDPSLGEILLAPPMAGG